VSPGRWWDNHVQKHNPSLSSSSFYASGEMRWCPTILSSQSTNILARYVTGQNSHGLCSTGSTYWSSGFSSSRLMLSGLNHIMYCSCPVSWHTLQLDTPCTQPYSHCETYISNTLTLKTVLQYSMKHWHSFNTWSDYTGKLKLHKSSLWHVWSIAQLWDQLMQHTLL
jgi:hypothetical protein